MNILELVKATCYEINLLKVLPAPMFDYIASMFASNAKNSAKNGLTVAPSGVKFSHGINIVIGKSTVRSILTSKVSAFTNHIVGVVLGRSHKKMIGIYTPWIVALVANVMAFRNWAVEVLIRNAMRGSRIPFSLSSADTHGSIATRFYDRCCPQPTATTGFDRVSFNSYFNRNVFTVSSFIHIFILYEVMGGTP